MLRVGVHFKRVGILMVSSMICKKLDKIMVDFSMIELASCNPYYRSESSPYSLQQFPNSVYRRKFTSLSQPFQFLKLRWALRTIQQTCLACTSRQTLEPYSACDPVPRLYCRLFYCSSSLVIVERNQYPIIIRMIFYNICIYKRLLDRPVTIL